MADYVVDVTGETGSPVLLLPGGAASSQGFFPGLVQALAGHRVVSLDRPGTGLAQDLGGRANLTTGSAAAAAVLTQLGAGPAVVVGQSLGGAQAVHFAMAHPELVAGLVLIDPTPLDVPAQVRMARRIFAVLGLPGRVPVVGPRLDRVMFGLLGKQQVAPEAREALVVTTTSASLGVTSRALEDFDAEAADLVTRLRPLDAPVVLLTADRKPGHAMRQSHERLVAAIGGRIVAPPQAVHAQQLRDPKGVNALVLELVAEATARA